MVVADIDIKVLENKFGNAAIPVEFDFTDHGTFSSALGDVDRVFIMRPLHLGKPEDLKPFINALKAKGDIKLVSFLSLMGVEHNPVAPHHKIEKFIEQAGLPYCHIRPSFFMQNISGVHAFEIKHFNRIVVPVKNSRTSFIDAEDIGELVATVLSAPRTHSNRGYSITGPETLDYFQAAEILSEELGRKIVYAEPKPRLAKRYWMDVRGLDKEYSTVMGMLYMMTRMGTAKKVTDTFEVLMGKKARPFRQLARSNLAAW